MHHRRQIRPPLALPARTAHRGHLWLFLVLIAVSLTAAPGARAQIDALCICDNQEGRLGEGCTGMPAFVPTPIYLLLCFPSGAQVLSWEARVTHDNANVLIGSWVVNGVDVDPDAEDFVVDCTSAPLLPNPQDVIVLASMQAIVLDASERIQFFIGPVPGSATFPEGAPGYVHTVGTATPAYVCSGDYTLPVFHINMCLMDAVEQADWGAIKALYGR